MAREQSTNILIIGSGVAGGLVAEKLLEKRHGPITMLEAGFPVSMSNRRVWFDIMLAGQRYPYEPLQDTPADYIATQSEQGWHIEGGRLFARGGSTLHWGGFCLRMKPEDFALKTCTNIGLDWPIQYADLEPYYLQAEQFLQVAGDSSDQDPLRSGPYPFEAAAYTMSDDVIIEALQGLGISYMHIPIARNATAIHGRPACVTTGTCKYCPVGARFTGDQPLDRLMNHPHFQLRLRSPVQRLVLDGKRRATGVVYLDMTTGETRVLHAETIILCAGALETPKLLLASATHEWPQGVGNDTDQVGRYLIANPYFSVKASKPTNPERLQEELLFETLGSRYWDTPQEQPEGKFFLGKLKPPSVPLAQLMRAGKSPADIDAAVTGEQSFELRGTIQTFSHPENRVLLAPGTTPFGLQRTQIDTPRDAYTAQQAQCCFTRMRTILERVGYTQREQKVFPQRGDHAMCTCRMSLSAAEGVVDPNLRVHEMDNLYIVSNAVFPSGAAVNPTLTLTALAIRFVDHLTAQL